VGIGVSGGGLEAYSQLFPALALDTGMAFIVVQHLDPKHESLLAELGARKAKEP
jgi:two-component system CheB/CheR fusion protein